MDEATLAKKLTEWGRDAFPFINKLFKDSFPEYASKDIQAMANDMIEDALLYILVKKDDYVGKKSELHIKNLFVLNAKHRSFKEIEKQGRTVNPSLLGMLDSQSAVPYAEEYIDRQAFKLNNWSRILDAYDLEEIIEIVITRLSSERERCMFRLMFQYGAYYPTLHGIYQEQYAGKLGRLSLEYFKKKMSSVKQKCVTIIHDLYDSM